MRVAPKNTTKTYFHLCCLAISLIYYFFSDSTLISLCRVNEKNWLNISQWHYLLYWEVRRSSLCSSCYRGFDTRCCVQRLLWDCASVTRVRSDDSDKNGYFKMAPNANKKYVTYVTSCIRYSLKIGLVPLPVFFRLQMQKCEQWTLFHSVKDRQSWLQALCHREVLWQTSDLLVGGWRTW
jgi:hypothetical protein